MSDQLTTLLISGGIVVGLAVAAGILVPALVRRLGRRWPPAKDLVSAAKTPFRILLLVVALNAVVAANRPRGEGAELWEALAHGLRIVGIINGAWLLGVVILFVIDAALRRADTDLDPRQASRIRTQVQVTRRVIIALLVVIALAAVLLTFDGVRAVGASLLASAGLASVIAAVAAQSALGNLFAGLQLAFSDAIRIGDVVVIEEQYGTIEEITLSYVVVKIWDDRRLVLPCTYFTATPFENWTRRNTEVMGIVEFHVDWRVDMDRMRAELNRVVNASKFWNERSHSLVVTDATGGMVLARATVTADDGDSIWFLQCEVREKLIAWVREHNPEGLPQQRTQLVDSYLLPGPQPTSTGTEQTSARND